MNGKEVQIAIKREREREKEREREREREREKERERERERPPFLTENSELGFFDNFFCALPILENTFMKIKSHKHHSSPTLMKGYNLHNNNDNL